MADTYHPRGKLVDGLNVRAHPLYWTWADMKSRCNDPKQPGYENYGGRGIGYCDRWRHFENFASDMGPRPHETYTLDRRDNDKDYSPENCTWATRTEQSLNRRRFRTNTSGHTGIVLTRNGRYEARFDYGKRRHHIGRFDSVEEAAVARARFVSEFRP